MERKRFFAYFEQNVSYLSKMLANSTNLGPVLRLGSAPVFVQKICRQLLFLLKQSLRIELENRPEGSGIPHRSWFVRIAIGLYPTVIPVSRSHM